MSADLQQRFFLGLFLFLISMDANGQDHLVYPTFTKFEGVVYDMPKIKFYKDGYFNYNIYPLYDDRVYGYDTVKRISMDLPNIPETDVGSYPFDGVDRDVSFCMILHSMMTVAIDGCYDFFLSSDDGSILWIDDELVIDNDDLHAMKTVVKTVPLTAGEHPVKLWYFQGYPNQFGLVLRAKRSSHIRHCTKEEKVIPSSVLFDSGSYELSEGAVIHLEMVAKEIVESGSIKVEVIGHTDDVGSIEDNLILSAKRAEQVADLLSKLINDAEVKIMHIGKGEADPVADNDSATGQEKNRRVQIVF